MPSLSKGILSLMISHHSPVRNFPDLVVRMFGEDKRYGTLLFIGANHVAEREY